MSDNKLNEPTLAKLQTKLLAAQMCHPNAVQALIEEALNELDEFARSSLSQADPSPQPTRHLTVTTTESGEAVMVSWQDDEHRILEVVWARKEIAPQPAVPVVSDEQIRKTVESIQDPDTVPAFHNGYYTLTPDELRRAILALRPAGTLTGCNCRWDGENQVEWCELHLAHKDAIHDWAERAKSAEQKLALRPAVEPMTPEKMRKAAMDEMSKIPALANHHSWKGWPGTWAFATAAVNGITAKAEDAHQPTKEAP